MSDCPDDATLGRLIAGRVPAAEAGSLEAHLGECDGCRDRLDELSGLTDVSGLLAAGPRDRPAESPSLRLAIANLQAESVVAPPRDLPPLPPSSRAGFAGRIGPIEVRRVIGRGGMGVVYEGLDPALDRVVAVKVLSPHLLGDDSARARFLREARAAAALSHEHVVTIHAIDEADGMPYLVMEYVTGESLADRLAREGRLPASEVARIGRDVARGLAAAHARGLVHRDVKPANILLDEVTGRARVADFGLAKVPGGDALTTLRTVPGTPAFMSPEQATGGPVDHRSDLYSLGVVLYAAASGEPPFGADSPLAILDRIRTADPAPLPERVPDLPGWLGEVVHRLLAKDPADRIQTAAEAAALLESGVPPPAARPTRSRRAVLARRRVLAGSGVAAAVGLAAAAYLLTREPGTAGPVAPPTPPATGFTIVGRAGSVPTFAGAVAAAADGDVIEVHGDGPHPSPTVEVRGKRLTVRAAAGAWPVIRPEGPGTLPRPQWLVTDSDLRLEGLDVQWPAGRDGKGVEPGFSRGVVTATGGRLALAHCRVVAGRRGVCVGSGGGGVTADHCHLAAENGVCLAWRPTPGAHRVAHCQLEGGTALFTDADPPPPAPGLEFANNTVAADRVWSLHGDAAPKHPVRVAARRNLLDVRAVLVLLRPVPKAKGLPAREVMLGRLRTWAEWSEEANVYRRGVVPLSVAGAQAANPVVLVDSLGDWVSLWKQPAAGSVEADIRFADRPAEPPPGPLVVAGLDQPSGPVPGGVGADPERLGPGPAYHARRGSP